jgi:hypothetical protein
MPHVKRTEIDRRLAAGEPGSQIARDYDLNPSSLHRHRVNCLGLSASNAIMKEVARGTDPGFAAWRKTPVAAVADQSRCLISGRARQQLLNDARQAMHARRRVLPRFPSGKQPRAVVGKSDRVKLQPENPSIPVLRSRNYTACAGRVFITMCGLGPAEG